MLPDLRLLITAIVVTFLLAAAAGLYASLRVTQEQIAARADVRASYEENPIMRIANSWPLPEPSRAQALRDLTKLPSGMPIVAATEPEPLAGVELAAGRRRGAAANCGALFHRDRPPGAAQRTSRR